MGLHCLCAAPHQEIGLTAMQGSYDIIQLFRLRFRHLDRDAPVVPKGIWSNPRLISREVHPLVGAPMHNLTSS